VRWSCPEWLSKLFLNFRSFLVQGDFIRSVPWFRAIFSGRCCFSPHRVTYVNMTPRAQKRLVLQLTEQQHSALLAMAKANDMSLSNYVRSRLGLPADTRGARKDLRVSPMR
jgi:hypothetical protein